MEITVIQLGCFVILGGMLGSALTISMYESSKKYEENEQMKQDIKELKGSLNEK